MKLKISPVDTRSESEEWPYLILMFIDDIVMAIDGHFDEFESATAFAEGLSDIINWSRELWDKK